MKILKSYKRRQSNCYLNEAFCSGDDFEPLLCDSRCEGKHLVSRGHVISVALFCTITSDMRIVLIFVCIILQLNGAALKRSSHWLGNRY